MAPCAPGKKTHRPCAREKNTKFNNAPGTIFWRKFVYYWRKNFRLDILAYIIYANNCDFSDTALEVFKIATTQLQEHIFWHLFIHSWHLKNASNAHFFCSAGTTTLMDFSFFFWVRKLHCNF